MTLLEVADLRVSFATEAGAVQAVAGVSFAVERGEVVALVGESGSGKSVTALSLMGLTRRLGARVSGRATFADADGNANAGKDGGARKAGAGSAGENAPGRIDLLRASELELRRLRGARMAMIFQDPLSSLNPVQRVGAQIAEQIRAHELVSAAQALQRAAELMDRVGIARAAERVRAYPHELSGGMRQRVMIAMAMSCAPELLIADEPTTALDVTTQAQILAQLQSLREQTGMGILLVTHDLGVVADVADRVLVMYAGRLVEQGSTAETFAGAQHPYTQRLLDAYTPRRPRVRRTPGETVLEARELTVHFRMSGNVSRGVDGGHVNSVKRGITGRGRPADLHALDGVSLTLREGETLGIVGESGAGKTTLIRCLLRLMQPNSGSIYFRGEDITRARRRQLAPVRRELQMVFQDAQASLNPRRRVAAILATGMQLRGVARVQRRDRAAQLLERVGLGVHHLDRYPHELSGGERQRVGIARALSCEPRAIVLDEPVSALDAPIRAQVLDLLVRLQEESGVSYLLVAHDLAVVRDVADRVAVMQAGRVVELAATRELFDSPQHPHTQALLAACLRLPAATRSPSDLSAAGLPGGVRSAGGPGERDDRAAAEPAALQHGEPAWRGASGAGVPGGGAGRGGL
jgi:ABC-type glutathione transport system ATPase component